MGLGKLRLSICIPTYNRVEVLRRTLGVICPQLNNDCELVVIDNASTDETSQTVRDFQQEFNESTIRYIKNSANIGGNSNILRCFEAADSDWIWILGDDDFPKIDAISTIFSMVPDNDNVAYINFQSSICDRHACRRLQDTVCTDLQSFVQSLDHFGNLLFISTGIYQLSTFRQYLIYGHQNIHTNAPHVAMMLAVLVSATNRHVVFSSARIVDWEPNTRGDHWDVRSVNCGIQYLTQLIPSLGLRKLLSDKIQKIHAGMSVASLDVFNGLAAESDWLQLQDALPPIAALEGTQQRFYSLTFKLGVKIFLFKNRRLAKLIGRIRSVLRRSPK